MKSRPFLGCFALVSTASIPIDPSGEVEGSRGRWGLRPVLQSVKLAPVGGGRIAKIVTELVLFGVRSVAPALVSEDEIRGLDGDVDSVALAPYRALLARLVAHDGGKMLLQAGVAQRELPSPIGFVLLNSDSVSLLFEKEARLARFIHSRHLLRTIESGPTGIVIEHVSSVPGEPPHPGEDLAACGQHIELLREIGCLGLRLRFPRSGEPERWVYDDGVFDTPPPGGGYHVWDFQWSEFRATRRPMPGLDELLLASQTRRSPQLDERETAAAAVERILRRDLARTWSVRDIAEALDLSPRTLQRSLAAESTSVSREIDRIRLDEAKRLLTTSDMSITEIGYVCGFADGAHFARRFKRRFSQTPSRYRAELRGSTL